MTTPLIKLKLHVPKTCELCNHVAHGSLKHTTLQAPLRVIVLCRDVRACDERIAFAQVEIRSTWWF